MKYFAGTTLVPTLARLVLALAFITAGYNKLFNDKQYNVEEAQRLQALEVDLDRRPAGLLRRMRLAADLRGRALAGRDPHPHRHPRPARTGRAERPRVRQ